MNALTKPALRRGPPDLNEKAAKHIRTALSELRGSMTSLAKARMWTGRCDADDEIQLELRKIAQLRDRLHALRRKLERTERYAGKTAEASP